MWLCTQHGFFSIAAEEDELYRVGAHARRDLENLLRLIDMRLQVREQLVDPRFHILIDLETFLELMVHLTTNLQYSRFPERVQELPDQAYRLPAYNDVWSLLQRAEVVARSRDLQR